MSAMPERVMLVPAGPEKASGSYYLATGTGTGAALYVPESRLLAAEARVREMEDGPLDYMSGKCDRLKEQNAALRADLDALVPLARKWATHSGEIHDLPENLRAILAREVGK